MPRRCMAVGAGGFTLIEMIMVIVITGIIGLVSTRFISLSVLGWLDTSSRSMWASNASATAEQIIRDIRLALPNSVRRFENNGSSCLELVPVLGSSDYLTLPLGSAGTLMEVVEFAALTSGDSGYVAVYPVGSEVIYGASGPGSALSSSMATLGSVQNHRQTLVFSQNERFLTDSPQRRVYLVDMPVAYCEDAGGRIWRYRGYGFAADSSQLLPATDATLMLDSLLPGSLEFGLLASGVQRNAVVSLRFTTLRSVRDGNAAGSDGERQSITREVHLLHVP
ncbi:type II secretion system protein [Candidatus Thalassolituus haligoni]|uniref:type II secretion system protein n=1 Tax=Candidatus Thalassolituus haligoni TaxID=3100113 RepID=UPI0035198D36|tara:strand:- start:10858 stop:11697 length:840 start_codon:yes stop_codon:yes gene_type:complete